MSSVDFFYEGVPITIQCDENDIMDEIIQRFCKKISKNQDEIYFIYGGEIIKKNETFTQVASSEDKQRKKLSVLCNIIPKEPPKEPESSFKKSKSIICPKCHENALINIKDFKIELFNCKNKDINENISFADFEQSQLIDESKIKCDICNNSNKSETYDNSFFICFTCKKNICPLCKTSHDKNHIVINYSEKDFKCSIHNDPNSLFCTDCNIDICFLCEKDHINHKKISLGELIPDKNELEEDKNNLRKKIDEFENDIQEIIKIFNDVIRNLENLYNIYDDLIANYEVKNRNYRILQNINYIHDFNNNFINNLNNIIKNKDYLSKFENIFDMWNQINFVKSEKIEKFSENNNKESNQIKKDKSEEKILANLQLELIMRQDEMIDSIIRNIYDYSIENIEKIKTYKKPVNQSFEKVISLNNDEILLFSPDIILVYNLTKNNSFYKEIIGLSDIERLSNGHLILLEKNKKLKIAQLKENDISIIVEGKIKAQKSKNIFVLSEIDILTYADDDDYLYFHKYENNELTLDNKGIMIEKKGINSICKIKQNEIIISCWENKKFFGYNYYLIFYDIKNKFVIKIIDIGGKMCLLNYKNLIVADSSKIYLIDLINRKILSKISGKHWSSKKYSLVKIFGDSFIIIAKNIYQYEIKNEKIVYKSTNIFNANIALMLPSNELLFENSSGITIFQFPKHS